MIDLEPIKARHAATSAGEWSWEVSADRRWAWVGSDAPGHDFWEAPVAKCSDDDDAEFIIHAHEDVPALVAEVERLRATEYTCMAAHAEVERLRRPISGEKRAAISNVLADHFGSSAAIRHEVTSEIVRILSIDESQGSGDGNG
jgi:hypothetical protein